MIGGEIVKKLVFSDYEDFAVHVIESFFDLDDEYGEISIIAKYEEAKNIIQKLITFGEFSIESMVIHREEYENYFDEYVISLTKDEIWCEPFKRDNGYLDNESIVTYVMGNCSSKVLSACDSEIMYEVSVGKEEKDNDGCLCGRNPDEDDGMHGFSINGSNDNGNYSCSFYTTEDIDMEDIKKILSKFSF